MTTFNPVGQPKWPPLPDPYHAQYPFGLLVFLIPLPGMTPEQRDEAVAFITDGLDRYHRKLGGLGVTVVVPPYNRDGRWEWIVSPTLSPHWTKDEEAKRMGILAVRLRDFENRITGV